MTIFKILKFAEQNKAHFASFDRFVHNIVI